MDKQIIGKWYDSGGKLTINIFDEYVNCEPKLLLSFGYSGYYNMAPNCSYEKDGYLCFELNDEMSSLKSSPMLPRKVNTDTSLSFPEQTA